MGNIFRQASYIFFAQFLTRIIGFFYTIFLANALGVLDFGLYSVALAYFSIISAVSDFGFNRFLIREIAAQRLPSWQILWNILILRLTIVSVFFAVFSLSIYFLDPDKIRVSIILLASLAVLPQVIAITFDGVFMALQKLQFSAIASFILTIATVFFGVYFMDRGLGVFGAILGLILGQIIYMFILLYLMGRHEGFKLASVTTPILKQAVLGSLPYGVLAVLGLLYFKIDIVILSYLRGNFETGIYATGYKFLEAVVFIPNALNFAIFPVLAKLHEESPNKIRLLFLKSVKTMFILGLIVMIGYVLLLPVIIESFLPKYVSAIDVVRILSLAIPFMFIHIPAASVLTSSDKYLKQVILFSIIPLAFNILLNIIFIPYFGFIAASWITVWSDIISVVVLFIFINKYIIKNA